MKNAKRNGTTNSMTLTLKTAVDAALEGANMRFVGFGSKFVVAREEPIVERFQLIVFQTISFWRVIRHVDNEFAYIPPTALRVQGLRLPIVVKRVRVKFMFHALDGGVKCFRRHQAKWIKVEYKPRARGHTRPVGTGAGATLSDETTLVHVDNIELRFRSGTGL